MLLDHGGDQAGGVAREARGDLGVEGGHDHIVPFPTGRPMMVSMTTSSVHPARSERLALCDTLEAVGPDAPTLCDPWRARDLAAHLVLRERRPDLAGGIVVPLLAGRLERHQGELAATTPWPDLVEQVRTGPPVWSPTRLAAVDNAVNFVEMVVHHEDVLRGDGARGPRRELPAWMDKAVWSALARSGSLTLRKAPVGVTLVAPGHGSVTAHKGEPVVTVTGSPVELLLMTFGRERVAEVSFDGDPEAVTALRAAPLGA